MEIELTPAIDPVWEKLRIESAREGHKRADRKRLRELIRQGLAASVIAARMGCSMQTVSRARKAMLQEKNLCSTD